MSSIAEKLEEEVNQENLKKYNDEPILYCKHCLSLRIMNDTKQIDLDFCDSCGSTDIGTCSIEEWQKLYKEKYGHDYLSNY